MTDYELDYDILYNQDNRVKSKSQLSIVILTGVVIFVVIKINNEIIISY